MEIFKRKFNKSSKSPPSNFVGLFVDDALDALLRIKALAGGGTKSKLIEDLLQDWQSKQKIRDEIIALVGIARDYYSYWVREPGKKGRGVGEFVKNVNSELKKAGLPLSIINDILSRLKTIIREENTRTRKKV